MARTKTTGPDANQPAATTLERKAVLDGAPAATPAAHGAPNPSKAAESKAPGSIRITKRVKGTPKIPRDVLILYEELTYGVDQKVSTNSSIPRIPIGCCLHVLTNGQNTGGPRSCGARRGD